jgi:hypothetical protein
MKQLLKSLLGAKARDNPATKPGPAARSKPTHAGRDYRAVSLAPNTTCHAATKHHAGKRYLMREAPRLPLPGCATPGTCSCRYRKHADRREADRRLFGTVETARWFAGAERRSRRERRARAY